MGMRRCRRVPAMWEVPTLCSVGASQGTSGVGARPGLYADSVLYLMTVYVPEVLDGLVPSQALPNNVNQGPISRQLLSSRQGQGGTWPFGVLAVALTGALPWFLCCLEILRGEEDQRVWFAVSQTAVT